MGLPEIASGLNLVLALLTRHKHQSAAVKNPLTGPEVHAANGVKGPEAGGYPG